MMNRHLKEIGKIVNIDESLRIVYFIGNQRQEEVYPKYEKSTN